MSRIAQTLRAVPDRRSSWLGSMLEDRASSGVTLSTRLEPTANAPHVASTTATIGSTSCHGTSVYDVSGRNPLLRRTATNNALRPVPATAPTRPPMTPTTSPARVMRARSDAPVAPTRRWSAITRVCPAMSVAQVLAVTIAPT